MTALPTRHGSRGASSNAASAGASESPIGRAAATGGARPDRGVSSSLTAAPEPELPAGPPERREEAESLDVVEMGVGEADVPLAVVALEQSLPELSDP